MKILVAGATGAVGRRLVPLLVEAGHDVSGTTRSAERAQALEESGARPLVVDVLDAEALRETVAADRPDVIIHQLTDLAAEDFAANNRLRREGTRNLVEAARAAGVEKMIAQSIAWLYVAGDNAATETDPLDPDAPPYPGVSALEEAVGTMPHGVVLRYGAFYGPGTWYAPDGAVAERVRAGLMKLNPAWTSFVHVDDAAAAAVEALEWPAGAVNIVDDEPALATEWIPVYCEAIGAPVPQARGRHARPTGRPISNAKARELGWTPQFTSWREGFGKL
ncbi:MAG TPA: NAD(P)-dependent oxidoreductase [Thermomonospora sp.]|nr:NAD(P)-dependent oxidoreductase [Thermomonospora sp.]